MFDIHLVQCSWVFVGVTLLFTSTYSLLYIFYAVTLEIKYWLMGKLILPIVGLSWMMAVFYKPKRTDAGYKRFLYFHFFTFATVSEVAIGVGDFRLGLVFRGLFTIFRATLWCIVFWLGLKLRASAAKLPPQELSDFLCQRVLVKGTAAMGPMLFFSFEAVSCFISQGSPDNEQCYNTSYAAMFLSVSLAVLISMSIFNKTVHKNVQRETSWELSSIASLKGLKLWQQVQGGLITITAITSLSLLSFLGVEGHENRMVFIIGATGAGSIAFAIIINMTMLIRIKNEQRRNAIVELPTTQRSVWGISSSDLDKGMVATAFV